MSDARTGRILRDEIGTSSLSVDRIAHVLFTMSGNPPIDGLEADLRSASPRRPQHLINLFIPDHQQFIGQIFRKIVELGNTK